jgi:phosphocarrier protein
MPSTEVEIINKLGLHARAAAKLVKLASSFAAEIELERDGRRINAKSIMGVMMLAASQGTTLQLHAEGEDADAASEAIIELINNYFDEGE